MTNDDNQFFSGVAHPAFGDDSGADGFGSDSGRRSKRSQRTSKKKSRSSTARTTTADDQKATSDKGSNRRLSGLLAIVFAVGVVALVGQGLSSQQPDEVWVLRASTQIRPWRDITRDQFEAVQVPAELVERGALQGSSAQAVIDAATGSDTETAVAGKRSLYPILPGQQIRPQVMLTTGDLLAAPLSPQERLVSITVPVERGVGGLLRNGDRVDIVRSAGGSSNPFTDVIAVDVEIVVVAPGEDELANLARSSGSTDPLSRMPDYPIPSIYVLRLPTMVAAEVLAAVEGGGVHLLYRPAGAEDPPLTADPTAVDPTAGDETAAADSVPVVDPATVGEEESAGDDGSNS